MLLIEIGDIGRRDLEWRVWFILKYLEYIEFEVLEGKLSGNIC